MPQFAAGTPAYSYIRFSTPEQALGDSLRRQLTAAMAYAEKHGLALDTTLRDLGVSAFGGANRLTGALGRFLAMVEEGRVRPGSVLIVESLDRLSRQTVLSAQEQLLGLIRAGITVVTLIDELVYSRESIEHDWTKLMLSIVYMSRAHEESASKARRVSEVWGAKRERAQETKEAQTSRCVAWCRLEGSPRGGARHVLIPERVEVLHRIFELTAAGYGQRQIAVRLNREGVATWGRGDGWQTSYIAKLLESRTVLGYFQPHTKKKSEVRRTPSGPEIAGYYPQAVPEELYYQAVAARSARKGRGGRKGVGVANILTGLGQCAACSRSMVRLNKGDGSKGGQWLVCGGIMRGMECAEPARWRYERAEAAVLRGVRRLNVGALLGHSDPAQDAQSRLLALKDRLGTEERRRDRLVEALGDVDDPAVVARLRAAAETVARLKTDLVDAERQAGLAVHAGSGLADRLVQVGNLTARMASLEGQELTDLRTHLAQELRRVLVRIQFTPWNVLADYRVEPGLKVSALHWSKSVPLIQSDEDKDVWAEQADIDEAFRDVPRMGRQRLPPTSRNDASST